MPDVLITVEHRSAEGHTRYTSVTAENIDSEEFGDEVARGAEIAEEDGICVETNPGVYKFIPPHAIHSVTFELIKETEK
jgi:hypothetical protein